MANEYNIGWNYKPAISHIVLSEDMDGLAIGQTFRYNGNITLYYLNGTSRPLSNSSCVFSGYDMSTKGRYTVDVAYTEEGKTVHATYRLGVVEQAAKLNKVKIWDVEGETAVHNYLVLDVDGAEAIVYRLNQTGFYGAWNSAAEPQYWQPYPDTKPDAKVPVYANSDIDVILNETFYNSLKTGLKNSIIPYNYVQDLWTYNTGVGKWDNYTFYTRRSGSIPTGGWTYGSWRKDEPTQVVGLRNCFALRISDIQTALSLEEGATIYDTVLKDTFNFRDAWLGSGRDLDFITTYAYLAYVNGDSNPFNLTANFINNKGYRAPCFKLNIGKLHLYNLYYGLVE